MPNAAGDGADHSFDSDGVRIAFDDVGDGPPVVLVHGFASSRRANWQEPGWYDALTEAGRRVIALDCRGHGESGTPHDPEAYGIETMAEDVVRLLDHLDVPEADVVGYSLGGRIAVQLLVDHPDRINAAVLGGVGEAIVRGPPNQDEIAEALEAEDLGTVTHPAGRRFRAFAEKMGGDLRALSAAMRAIPSFDLARLSEVGHPVLVVAGEEDSLVEDPAILASHVEGAESVVVPGRNHMTTVGDPRFEEAVVDFLEREGL